MVGYLEGIGSEPGHRVAVQGLDLAAEVSGLRSAEDAAGALRAAQVAEPGGERGRVRLGAGTAAGGEEIPACSPRASGATRWPVIRLLYSAGSPTYRHTCEMIAECTLHAGSALRKRAIPSTGRTSSYAYPEPDTGLKGCALLCAFL